AGPQDAAFPVGRASRKLRHAAADQQEGRMPAYFVAEVEVTNPEGYEPYRALAGASIAQYGGRFLVRGGAAELIEGSPAPQRVVITEFAHVAAAKRWYNSPEHQKALPIRRAKSKGRAFMRGGARPERPSPKQPGTAA